MWQTYENLSRLGVAHSYESLVLLAQGLVSCLVTLNDFSDFLVDNQQVIVFV